MGEERGLHQGRVAITASIYSMYVCLVYIFFVVSLFVTSPVAGTGLDLLVQTRTCVIATADHNISHFDDRVYTIIMKRISMVIFDNGRNNYMV